MTAAVRDADRTSEPEVVILRPCVTVAREALHLAIDLELRGVSFRLDRGALIARPRNLLSEEDIACLKRHKEDLKRIITYEAPPL